MSISERKWDGSITRYPDPAIEVIDSRFAKYNIGNSVVERFMDWCTLVRRTCLVWRWGLFAVERYTE